MEVQPHDVTIVADGQEITGKFIFGSVSNSTVIGGIVKLAESDVTFDDGMFEVLLIKQPSDHKGYRRVFKSIAYQSYNADDISFFKASKISFSFDKNTDWSTDGEYAGTLMNVNIENLTRAMQLIAY